MMLCMYISVWQGLGKITYVQISCVTKPTGTLQFEACTVDGGARKMTLWKGFVTFSIGI